MRPRHLILFVALFLAVPVSAQSQESPGPTIAIDCDSVEVSFRTSIQADSATVGIVSNAGPETHPLTLAQGGADVSFPLDGQDGEPVTVTVTLVWRGVPDQTTATETLEGCAVPSPSSSLSPSPDGSPSPVPTTPVAPVVPVPSPTLPATTPPPTPSPTPTESLIPPLFIERDKGLPEELAFTGPREVQMAVLIGLIIGLFVLGLWVRHMGRRMG